MPASRFLRACRRLSTDRVPVWFMRQAGRYMKEYRALRQKYSILTLAKTPELAAQVTLQPIKKMDVDAAIIFADILLPVEPLGLRLRFAPGPVIDDPIRSARDVRRLRDFDPRELSYVFKAVNLVRWELDGHVPLIGFAGAPFTLASYMIEGGPSHHFLKTKAFMQHEPSAWDLLMRKLRKILSEYLKGQIRAGAQAVQLFDSWVGALSPEQYRRHVLPHSGWLLKSVSGLTAPGVSGGALGERGVPPPLITGSGLGAPTIHFGTGTAGFLEDFAAAGGDVVGVDWRVDLAAARRRLKSGQAIQGNLDPALLFAPRNILKAEVRRILAQDGRRGFIFNLGHGILPETPFDNVRAVVDWVHEYGHA